jgi:predicted alpha/beta-fold hydrolase
MLGYSSTDEYYTKASCVHRLQNIEIPTFFINSLDDPISEYIYFI